MASFKCPNCHEGVKVKDQQFGKTLRCPHCHGRFMVDPGLPPGLNFETFDPSAEPPEVQAVATEERAPRPPLYFESEPARPGGWGLFWIMLICEFAIGFMYGYANSYRERDWLYDYNQWVYPLWQNPKFLLGLSLLVLADVVMKCMAIFHIARRLQKQSGAAIWIIVVVLIGAIGFGAFLVNQRTEK